jgi:TatA/E family protein of Tat protein translocase
MLGSIGPQEILIVLVIALVVLGPKKLPELARSLGRGVSEFRQGIDDHDTAGEQSPAGSRVHELPLAEPSPLADAS